MKPDEKEVLDQALEKDHAGSASSIFPVVRLAGTTWRGEEWVDFDWVANDIEEWHQVSKGVAERTLRELCATGDVRSIKADSRASVEEPEEPEIIRPSEWGKDQVDLTVDGPMAVFVSGGDIQYWLDQQAKASGEPPKELVFPIGRTSRKQELARKAVSSLWPQGVPQEPTNPQIETQVDQWITVYCKKNNIAKPEIGRDTVLRAAGRRR